MKPIHLLLLATTLLASCVSTKQLSSEVTEVSTSQDQRFAITVAGDTAALRDYLHPDLLYIHSNGLEEDVDGHLLNIGGGKIDYQSFTPLQAVEIEVKGKLALVDGLVAVTGLYDSYEFTVNLRYTAIYQKTNEQWQLLRWQSTKVEED